jgi:hypothetical protein
VASQVELLRNARARSIADRLDRDAPHRPHATIETPDGDLARRIVLQLGAIAQVREGVAKGVGGRDRWDAAGCAFERDAQASHGCGG